jgi:hypothetical protein
LQHQSQGNRRIIDVTATNCVVDPIHGGGNRRLSYFVSPLPRFEQIHCTNAKDYRSGGDPMQTLLRYPTVTCPGCKRPMMPSRPLPVSEDTELCDVTYTCEDCGATTTRTIKIEK